MPYEYYVHPSLRISRPSMWRNQDMATDRKPRGACWQLVKRMTRKKLIDMSDTQTSLHRCLTAKRLTFVGIGSMMGAGIYVLVGIADKNLAGPSVIISFLLAALCICMTSFCFAEFASRNPKSGNPYLYIYVAYGEFMAFIVSWGFILSYIASGSLCARAWSGYVDSLVNNSIKNYTMKHIGNWTVGEPISQFPDFLGFGIQFFITFIAATGAHCSTTVNSVLTGLNVAVLSLVMVMGAVYGNLDNWHNVEHGGFFPFGFEGVMQGTSACFYAFFGFETVCIAAEEAKDPSKSVPRGIIASIAITTLLYVGTATAFTLLVPFWLVNERAPLTTVFDYAGPSWMKYVVSIGPLCGFSNILLLNTYGFSRLCYSLSEEGLLWKSCSRVNRRTKVPMIPLFVGGLAMSLGGFCLELENLFRFSVIVTILPYALVSFGVIILRYDSRYNKLKLQSTGDCKFLQPEKEAAGGRLGGANLLGFCPDFLKKELWILISCFGIRIYILIIFLATALLSALVLFDWNGVKQMTGSSVLTFCTLVIIILGSIIAITSHERPEPLSLFKVPLVPFFPIVSGMLNVFFLVAAIDKGSAIGYVVIVVIGISIYLGICVWDLLQSGSTGHGAAQTEMEMENLLADSEDHTFTQTSSS